jgi:hypothetical protein
MEKVTLRFVREEDEQLAVLETLIRETPEVGDVGDWGQTPAETTIPARPGRGRLERVALFATTLVVGIVGGLTAVALWVAPHWTGASGSMLGGAMAAPKAEVSASVAPAVTYTVVQAGVFAQRASATQMAAELRKRGLPGVVADATSGPGAGGRYRVWAAVAGSRAEAVRLAQRLAAEHVVSYVTDVTLPRVSAGTDAALARANTAWLQAAVPAVNAQLAVDQPRPFATDLLPKINPPITKDARMSNLYLIYKKALQTYQKKPTVKKAWGLQTLLLLTLSHEQTLRQSP